MADRSDAEYLAYVHGRTPALRRVAHLLCGDPHHADDRVQETQNEPLLWRCRLSR